MEALCDSSVPSVAKVSFVLISSKKIPLHIFLYQVYRHILMRLMFSLNEMSLSLFSIFFSSTEATHLYSITENKHNGNVQHTLLLLVFILSTQVRTRKSLELEAVIILQFINKGDLNKTIVKNLIFKQMERISLSKFMANLSRLRRSLIEKMVNTCRNREHKSMRLEKIFLTWRQRQNGC